MQSESGIEDDFDFNKNINELPDNVFQFFKEKEKIKEFLKPYFRHLWILKAAGTLLMIIFLLLKNWLAAFLLFITFGYDWQEIYHFIKRK